MPVMQENSRSLIAGKGTEEKNIKYPMISGYRFKRDIFADLIKDLNVNKNTEKEKKPEPKPAPPLPILPSQQEILKEEKQEVKVDKLNNIILLGIMDKKEKRFAFIKRENDIKSFKKNDRLFDTDYFIERISKNEVVLVDVKGEKRILKLDKEGHNEKKD
ncbi:MAG: hypothetical protein N2999_03660 [Proteobacteria bacterium]|nr:hypothetical protein [Pseudomonadota bacterium]